MEGGAEQDALFYEKRRIAQGKDRDSRRRRPITRVMSREIDIKAETPDIGESSSGGAKSVKERLLPTNTTKGVGGPGGV